MEGLGKIEFEDAKTRRLQDSKERPEEEQDPFLSHTMSVPLYDRRQDPPSPRLRRGRMSAPPYRDMGTDYVWSQENDCNTNTYMIYFMQL